ncbi:SMC-Scp complex subunit ScpB [Micromonospora sp. NPDC093277]|uniref:SMC-Scp complex subunit ScpB n=1 Tax=Micromonospora sp. NPDC093277 TaxID=3364291 RepID=UPI003811D77A
MSDEERRDSLADQAAAWVPPWQRPAPAPAPERPEPELEPEPESAGPASPTTVPEPTVPEPAAGPGSPTSVPEPAAEGQPASDPAPEPAPDAEPDPTLEPVPDARPEPAADFGSEGPPEGPTSSKIFTVAETDPQAAPDLGAEAPLEEPNAAKIPEESSGVGTGSAETAEADESAAQGDEGGVPAKRGRRRAAAPPEPAPELSDAELRGALEAILLVVDQPVSELTLAQVLEQSPERIGPMLDDIAAGYTAAGHGFELRRAAGGWRLYTRPEYASYVERFVLDGQSVRLTQAALETLAVVAYKQPVTRSRISAIRGVNCDGVLRTLVSRGLVEECGTEPDSGAFLYRTTIMFLEKLGLNSVDDLPPLAPFLPDDVEELADATR